MVMPNNTPNILFWHRAWALVMVVSTACSPVIATAAAPPIPGFYGTFSLAAPKPGTLPDPRAYTFSGGTIDKNNTTNQLTVTQNQGVSNVVIDWNSFNIAAGSTVRFYQGSGTPGTANWAPNREFAALNRIYDSSPSQIYGNLIADGKIYLINRNGILFGSGSQVNVHSLVGSALNITLDNFNKGLLRFTTAANANQSATLDDSITIANHGTITTDSGGSVSLIGPRVENAGTITTPQGSVNLIGIRNPATGGTLTEADLDVLTSFDAGAPNVIYNSLATPGTAINFSSGVLRADSGRAGMYGDTVQQGGIVRSVSAVKKGGEIFLQARSRVTTDAGSVTDSPVSDSSEKVNQTFVFNGGSIQVSGITTAGTFVTGLDGTYAKKQGDLQVIEHNGSMSAPSGTVNLTATSNIFMNSGSSIDVAGKWVDLPASANVVSSTLNSVELRDSYGQKNGTLTGDKIQTDLLNGSAIGNISGSYTTEDKSAMERSTRGGTITLLASNSGQIVVNSGATLDFSGGGFRYAQGSNQTSLLAAGNRIYDISSAPQWFNYTLLDNQSKTFSHFGITETFSGLYYGGASSVNSSSMGRIAGSDAGTLSLAAGVIKLDGTIHGDVTRGIFQTQTTAHTSFDVTDTDNSAYFANVARGLEKPTGGTLLIGVDPGTSAGGMNLYNDSIVQEITVRPSTAQSAPLGANDKISGTRTELSAAVLSGAGLSNLSLFSNTSLTIENGARISLASGGNFIAKARRIEEDGDIVVRGGTASFTLQDNITSAPALKNGDTSRYTSIVSNLYFASGSSVNVSGETIDNTSTALVDSGADRNGILNGGKISIKDLTVGGEVSGNNLVIASGATLNVNGGYLIDQTGKVNGGDAGSLELRAMNMSLEGNLTGLALLGKKGGEIILHAGEIVVGQSGSYLPGNMPPDTVPSDQMNGKLLLSQDRFKDSGFTRLNLNAINDVTFSSGIDLKPSIARLPSPVTTSKASTTTDTVPTEDLLNSPDYLGQTSIKVSAGVPIYGATLLDGVTAIIPNQNAKIQVEQGALLRTTGGGSISLSASGIDIAGTLSSPGGTVSITAKGTANVTDVNLMEGSTIFAGGYNKPDGKTVAGTPASFVPQAAGTITLAANGGSVNVNYRSLVDVSGSSPVSQQIRNTGAAPQQIDVAGNPGTLNIGYKNSLTLDGIISGAARSAGVIGGTLTVTKYDTDRTLEISAADISLYQSSGFDALKFISPSSIKLPSTSISAGRSLTLDTPILTGNPGGDTSVQAPWLRLMNTSNKENLNPGQTLENGGGKLTLAGTSLDVTGNIQINGFQDVALSSARDLTFSDRVNSNNNGWIGNLWTTGNITLQAQRIYPTTAASYSITANGKATILPYDSNPVDTASIYSAGGSLSIKANGGIEDRGVLAAPMGSISLDGVGNRVFLADGSSIITGGSVPVSYGYFDGAAWSVKGINNQGGTAVTTAPGKSVLLNGSDVVIMKGATIDSSGGGSIYSALWQSGLEGSVNPFAVSTRYVILPDNSVKLPGKSIYLDAAPELGLKAGVYSILPADFAFVPGALVIQSTGTTLAPGVQAKTAQGYDMVAGYETVSDTAVKSSLYSGYTVRLATDVQKEGNFTIKQYAAADGGSITVTATNTAIIAGSLNGASLSGGQGAVFTLNGSNVQVKQTVSALNSDFDFSTPIPVSLANTMQIEADSISNKGLKELNLGNSNTKTVVIDTGSVVQASVINLTASSIVTLGSDAQLLGTNDKGTGTVTVNVPNGSLTVDETALIRANSTLTLNASDMDLRGGLKSDNGSLNISAQNIFFVPDAYQRNKAGLYLNKAQWNNFSQFTDLTLKSANDMVFQRDVSLTAAGSLTLDAGRFVNQAGQSPVSIEAHNRLNILNSGSTLTSAEALAGQLTLGAGTIVVSSAFAPGSQQGGVLFDGFATVNMNSAGDLLLQGAGSIATSGALKVTASRLAATYLPDVSGAFLTAADFRLSSGGAFTYTSANGTPGITSNVPGGNLSIQGSSVQIGGLIDMPSGNISLTAVGSGVADNVYLETGASIQAHGAVAQTADSKTTVSTPGGRVTLSANAGQVEIAAGSVVDVSAAKGSDAGTLELSAPNGEVTIAGTVLGKPVAGRGGSFSINSLDLNGVGSLDNLSNLLSVGGFTEHIAIQSRSGDLSLSTALTAREVVVEADGGSIRVKSGATINANGTMAGDAGGRVELYAKTAVTLEDKATVSAVGKDGAAGGSVLLSTGAADKISGQYALQVNAGSKIDVSGGTGGAGGTVSFRAYELPVGNDVNMAPLPAGAISGASLVSVEEAKKYSVNGNIGAYGAPYNTFMSDADMAALKSKLFAQVSATNLPLYHLLAGIELVSDPGKDLVLDTPWDLTSVRPGGEAGVLTLRAAGNLNIANNLVDHPSASYATLHSDTMQHSWGFNLVAGADLNGASPLSVVKGQGNLVIGPMNGDGRLAVDSVLSDSAAGGAVVYTENASIRFTSGNNTDIGFGVPAGFMINPSMRYNIGSYGGTVQGETGGDLTIRAGAIQTAVGDIDLRIGGNLDLMNRKDGSLGATESNNAYSIGSIRTTGEFTRGATKGDPDVAELLPATVSDYWTYAGGGSIKLNVGGSVSGYVNNIVVNGDIVPGDSNAWDTASGGSGSQNKYLTANFNSTDTTEGIATLAGGNISVWSGKGFTSQIGTFGNGNLSLISGGDSNGRYRSTNGSAAILSMGNFGTTPQVLEMAASQVQVVAMGDLNIGAVLNPNNSHSGVSLQDSVWDLTYAYKGQHSGSLDSSASLISLAGSANLSGTSTFDGYKTSGMTLQRQLILPPVTEIISSGDLQINGRFALAPSPSGNLRLISGGNITSTTNSTLAMVDVPLDLSSPEYVYQRIANLVNSEGAQYSLFSHTGINLLHKGDTSIAEIKAGVNGDIVNLQLNIDKPVEIQAGRDITELVFGGQNLQSSDITSIRAGRDLSYDFSVNQPSTALEVIGRGIKLGGPGALLVEAGRNINLGNSTGIQSVGGYLNPPLGENGASVTVIAGSNLDSLTPTDVATFFYGADNRTDHADPAQNGLIKAGDDYSKLKNAGETAAAEAQLAATRSALIRPNFSEPASNGDGYVAMTSSQINSLGGSSDVNVLARGSLDVGKSSIGSTSQQGSGISTAGGGRINIYAGKDINVNESRIMSYLGGDISIWVDTGDLNAGRGSRTSISPSPPRKVFDLATQTFITKFTPPAVGSGIRAVTFDPNTVPGGPLPIPEAGNINIYVPNGKIDAGEAGIVTTNKLTLAATEFVNVKNISGGAGSVGVPLSSDNSVSLGAMAGNSNLTDSSKMIETASTGGLSKDATKQKLTQAPDDFLSKYLDVKVIGFDADSAVSDNDSKEEQDKKRKK